MNKTPTKIELGTYFPHGDELNLYKGDKCMIVFEKSEPGKTQQICYYKSGRDVPLVEVDGRRLAPVNSEYKDAPPALQLLALIAGEEMLSGASELSRHFFELPDGKEITITSDDKVFTMKFMKVMPNYIKTLYDDCVDTCSNMVRTVKSATGNIHMWLDINKTAIKSVYPDKF